MSSVVITGDTSGSVTLSAPAVAGTTTLTLPTANGTIITTGSSGQSIPKAALPTGSVLQVVSQNYSTNFESSTNTFTDTGITVSITPTSATSKILVLITLSGVYKDGSNSLSGLQARLVRGSTTLQQFSERAGYNNSTAPNHIGGISFNYLDSPATTSSTTYKVQASNKESSSKAAININGPSDSSSITLMEISA